MRTRQLTWMVVVACVAGGCTTPPAGLRPPEPIAEPPSGHRWQGVGDVVVAVPKTWRTETDICTLPDGDLVLLPASTRGTYRCGVSPTRGVSSLVAVSHGSRTDDVRCRPSSCRATFGDEDAHVWFRVTARGPSARGVAESVRDSLTVLPTGWTTVPAVRYGEEVDDVVRRLAAAGLHGTSPDVDWPHYVTRTRPSAGAVVAEGETIALEIGDG